MRKIDRRQAILEILEENAEPVTGGELARRLGVSRQVIVQDIALLRARGIDVLATPQGYRLARQVDPRGVRSVLSVSHPPERTAEELFLLVDLGIRVLDVIVEHPIYGEIRGDLMLESREDVRRFLLQLQRKQASLLSSLTGGRHWHTVEARDPRRIEKAEAELRRLGILVDPDSPS